MKTILITGGTGFIGSHLCDRLIKNNKIICVDNLFTGSKDNIKHLMNNKNFRFIQHDIIEPLFDKNHSAIDTLNRLKRLLVLTPKPAVFCIASTPRTAI